MSNDISTTPYMSSSTPSDVNVTIIEGTGGPAGFTDTFALNIKSTESNAAPADADTFQIALAQSESNAAQSETAQLGISGSGNNDANATPTETRSVLIRVWLSASAGTDVANAANANGQNDGALATVSTGLLASNPEVMTSALGVNVPSGITFSSAIYRGWFRAQTTLITSTASVIARSIGALFADITMFTQSSLGGDTNHLAGTFTFDLIAAGVNTLAKLQSLQIIHQTQDLTAGVTPAVLTVDAGAVDIVATSI